MLSAGSTGLEARFHGRLEACHYSPHAFLPARN
jgi:hypothetical protein